jgi:hypothetical protein
MAQKSNPSVDTYNSDGYTDQVGGITNIYTTIDEGYPFSDADYIRSAVAPSSDVYVTKLSTAEDPQSSSGHIIRFKYAKDAAGGAQVDLTVQLRQGYVNEGTPGTLIHEKVVTNISNVFTDDSFTLSAGEADAITNYADLYLRFVSNQV